MSKSRIQPRSVARLAAVQALYQMEVSGVGVDAVVREFSEHRFDRDVDGEQMAAADETFFAELAKGVVAKQGEVDQAIVKRLASGWRLDRLDATARAVLRAGAFELMHRPDVPTEVVIDEYVEIAKSFFEGPEAGFINGALDAIARDART
ncbi:transcription antitermination factor NusB [Caulobacter henricii]|uniref:Transcription antitermination protein NusB n=1 Tax=Caulobacter henricii TaxID=69395 RepID=A0A0P0NZN5_9CAUL|nr:transcription antitermination factor NusB [Caulobacter henricii]ALL13640.1 antitermination protein NusB [Caulobacter henricii]